MAAASITMQSYLASPMAARARAGNFNSNSSINPIPRNPRGMRVRCQAEEEKQTATNNELKATTPVTPSEPTVQTPPKPKMASISDILAFSGPAPERINGRLAMIGFVAALGAELARGDDLAAQLANGAFPWFLTTAVIFSAASLIPLFKGVTVQSKSGGLMTADAEMWNGRFAMLGLVALAFTEYVKGGPLV